MDRPTKDRALAVHFTKPDGSPIKTVQDVADTTAASAFHSDEVVLHGVVVDDSGDPPKVICYTGNGPTSEKNAGVIAIALNAIADISNAGLDGIEAVKALPELIRFVEEVERAMPKKGFGIEARGLLARLKGDAE